MLVRSMIVEVEDEKLAAACGLVETLRSEAGEINKQRSLPAKVLTMLDDAGLINMMRPARFGGPQMSLHTAMKVGRELARGDASVAWVHGVYTGHAHIVGLFPEEVQDEYWASADVPLSASSYMPAGKVTPVDGGWKVSGTWSFCSGVDHVHWTVVGAITGMIPGDRPTPDRRLFMLPASDYTIVDDWQVMGLRGTGSKSIVVDDVFVPSARVIRDADISNGCPPGAAGQEANEFRYSAWPLLTFGLVGLAPKIAQNAYEQAVVEISAGGGKPNPLFDSRRPAAAMHLAEASAKIDAAELLFSRALDETFAVVEAGEELTMDLRVRNRRDQCFAAKLAHEATSLLLGIGGARGIREGGTVQRAFRDLCALTLHPGSNWDATAISFGNVAMGGSPTEMIF